MYGCTFGGGAANTGTIYRIAADGTFAVLQSLGTPPFSYPCHELTAASDGHLYGMSGETVFRLTTGGVLSAVAAVSGVWPPDVQGGLIDGGDGKLYGINTAGQGQIFSTTFGGTVEVLHSFSFFMGPFGLIGEASPWSLIDGRDGFFSGTTAVVGMAPFGSTGVEGLPHLANGSIQHHLQRLRRVSAVDGDARPRNRRQLLWHDPRRRRER